MKLLAVNYHLYKPCNLHCRFCFATFREVGGYLPLAEALQLLKVLHDTRCQKITFVGGEPTLHPHIGALLKASKELGFVTCLVTNGAKLRPILEQQPEDLDWIGFSIDSANEETQAALGRGKGDYIRKTLPLIELARSKNIRIKLNTVVTKLNYSEDLSSLVRAVKPERWKAFQVLRVEGENDGSVEDLLITKEEFAFFLQRHGHLAAEGFAPVPEDNNAMEDSYAMIDPLGRFYGNTHGKHTTSAPILQVGVQAALVQVNFSQRKLVERGGVYNW